VNWPVLVSRCFFGILKEEPDAPSANDCVSKNSLTEYGKDEHPEIVINFNNEKDFKKLLQKL
jgi:hypothetical protein